MSYIIGKSTPNLAPTDQSFGTPNYRKFSKPQQSIIWDQKAVRLCDALTDNIAKHRSEKQR